MFVRNDVGIRRLEKLIEEAQTQSIWERLTELRKRYEKTCSNCRKKFWVTEENRETDWFGDLEGYRCPECGTIWKPEG